jgi:hypothetical protein
MTADFRLFSDRQRRLVAFALAFSALLASAALLVVLVWALEWLVGRFANVLPSLRAVGEGLLALVSVVTGLAVIPIYRFFFLRSRTEPTAKLGDHRRDPLLGHGARGISRDSPRRPVDGLFRHGLAAGEAQVLHAGLRPRRPACHGLSRASA